MLRSKKCLYCNARFKYKNPFQKYCTSKCKSKAYTKSKRGILAEARKRAKAKDIEYNLEEKDIILPKKCPVLGIELKFNEGQCCDNSYSLDRLDPNKGYVKGNVVIMSNRANRIKSNANIKEIKMLLNWMKKNV